MPAPDSGSAFDVLNNGDYVFRATVGGGTEIDVSMTGPVVAAPAAATSLSLKATR